MELVSTKIVVLTLLGVLRLFFGLVPLKITKRLQLWGEEQGISHGLVQQRRAQVELAISLCLCFGGGVLLATCFIHMIPEVRESIEAIKRSERSLLPSDSNFPFAELFICIGFFVVYIIEEVAHRVLMRNNHKQESSTTQQCCSTVESELGKTEDVPDKQLPLTNDSENNVVSTWNRPKSSSKIAPATSRVHLLASTLSLEQKEVKTNHTITTVQCQPIPPPHHHHHHHHHHHESIHLGEVNDHSIMGHIRSLLVVVALSFHSVFEGLAIGLQQTERDVWYLFTAVSIHACAILFWVGLELVMSGVKLINFVVYVVILAITSPLGVMVGILITAHAPTDSALMTLIVAVLQGMAGGTILYVTFFEVLDREKKRDTGNSALRMFFILLGFSIMVALQAFSGHDHGKEGHMVLPLNATQEVIHRHEHRA